MREGRVTLVSGRDEEWARRFEDLRDRIARLVADSDIQHIGSTAVPDFVAKDVVDVLVGVDADRFSAVVDALAGDGFDLEGERLGHAWLCLPDRHARVAVVHVVEHGGEQWLARLAFRDLLIQDASAREAYLAVKTDAAVRASGWGDYTAMKAAVVERLLAQGSQG